MKWLTVLVAVGLLFALLDFSAAKKSDKDTKGKDKKTKDKSKDPSGSGTGTGMGNSWTPEHAKHGMLPPDQALTDDTIYWAVKLDHPAVTCGSFALDVEQMGWGTLDVGTPFAGAPFKWDATLPPGFEDGATGTYRFAQATPLPDRHMQFAGLANCKQDSNPQHNDGGDIYCVAATITYALIDDNFKGTGVFNKCKIAG